MEERMRSEIHEIIRSKRIKTLFQPVVELKSGGVIGYEAFSRGPEGETCHSPVDLIQMAERAKSVAELDELMRNLAIERASGMEPERLLFLNVEAKIISEPQFIRGMTRKLLLPYGLEPGRTVIEIAEKGLLSDGYGAADALLGLRRMGFKLSIDDAGGSFDGFKAIRSLRPEFVKIDMAIVRDLHGDKVRQAMVKGFAHLGQEAEIRIIAEGIESQEELKMLISLGVWGGQGFYLQKSSTQPLRLSDAKQTELRRCNHFQHQNNSYSSQYHYVGMIADSGTVYHPDTPCSLIDERFKSVSDEGFAIVSQDQVFGMITRRALNRAMATQYGHALYSRRPIALLHDEAPLIVDYYTPINRVSEMAMDRSDDKIYDPVIVCQGSRYHGMVSVRHLVRYATEMEKDYAKELNPLTHLPGNAIITRVLGDIVGYAESSAVVYFDLDHFKCYNDVYGFENGDQLIKMTSSIIQEVVKRTEPVNGFVGHIGGDDFVAVIDRPEAERVDAMLKEIGQRFDEEKLAFYSESDLKTGFIETEDRGGVVRHFPLTALSMACILGNLAQLESPDKLAMEMAHLKKIAKSTPGTSVAFSFLEA